jgi:hypothetical protein
MQVSIYYIGFKRKSLAFFSKKDLPPFAFVMLAAVNPTTILESADQSSLSETSN